MAGCSSSTGALDLQGLDDDLAVAVLKQSPKGSLGTFASASQRLSRLARTSIPCQLVFKGHESIAVLSSSGGPFSGCTNLVFDCRTAADLNAMSRVALHASQHYTNLRTVWLRCMPSSQDAAAQELLGDGTVLVGPLGWLRGLVPLRQLALVTPTIGADLPAAAAQLTQLTSLQLQTTQGVVPADLTPLAGLPQLQFLMCKNVAVAAAVEGQSCVPSSLQELQVVGLEVSPAWWSHLTGCPQLTSLSVHYDGEEQYAGSHPSHVTRAAAQACKQLRSLRFQLGTGVKHLGFRLRAPDAMIEEPPGSYWDLPEEAAALTGLTQLYTPSTCCLRLHTDSSWWLLRRLKQLSQVDVLQVDTLPPSRLQLPWVGMSANLSLSYTEVLQLLGSCEQLEDCELNLELRWQPQQQQQQLPQQQQQQASALTDTTAQDRAQASRVVGARLRKLVLRYTADASPQQGPELAAQHFAALVHGVPHVQELYLGWPRQDTLQPVLPDLAPLSRLTMLVLSSGAEHGRVSWRPEHVLHVLQGKESTLERLYLEHLHLVSPRIALMLSSRFPLLQQLDLNYCKGLLPQTGPGAGSKEQEEQALKQVKQLLRPGFELFVTYKE